MYQFASALQKKTEKPTNRTGIPDAMKDRFESQSGMSLADVKVHYNSDKPAQVQALAFTQGNRVYVGPGQERHLGHELMHVLQQKTGAVRPTTNVNGIPVNDDARLEKEAEQENGLAALHASSNHAATVGSRQADDRFPIQRKVGMEFQTVGKREDKNIYKLKDVDLEKIKASLAVIPDESIDAQEARFKQKANDARVRNMRSAEASNGANLADYCEDPGRVTIKDEGDYKISSDGYDLEYITKAFDERTQKDTLVKAVEDAGNLHNNICNGVKPAWAHAKIGNFFRVTLDSDTYYININGTKTAHPQATMGVKFESIPTLIDRLATSEKSSYLSAKDSEKPWEARAYKALSNISKIPLTDLKTDPAKAETIKADRKTQAFIQLVEHYVAATEGIAVTGEQLQESISAFRRLVTAVTNKLTACQRAAQDAEWKTSMPITAMINAANVLDRESTKLSLPQLNLTETLTTLHTRKTKCENDLNKLQLDINNLLPPKYTQVTGLAQADVAGLEKKLTEAQVDLETRLGKLRDIIERKEQEIIALQEEAEKKEEEAKQEAKQEKLNEHNLKSKIQAIRNKCEEQVKKHRSTKNNVERASQNITNLNIAAQKERYLAELIDITENIATYGNQMNASRDRITTYITSAKEKMPAIPVKIADEPNPGSFIRVTLSRLESYIKKETLLNKDATISDLLKTAQQTPSMYSQTYHKTLLAIKTRTSFYDLYKNLTDVNQQKAAIAYFRGKYNETTLIRDTKDKGFTTLYNWLDGLEKSQTDLLSYELQDNRRSTEAFTFTAYGVTRSTDIGYDTPAVRPTAVPAHRVIGALVELRHMKRQIPPLQWKNAAAAVADCAQQINADPAPLVTLPRLPGAASRGATLSSSTALPSTPVVLPPLPPSQHPVSRQPQAPSVSRAAPSLTSGGTGGTSVL